MAMFSEDIDIRRLMAIRAIESGLLRLKWLAAATRFEIAMRRHDRALRYALKYDPSQPRVPRGNSDGGQWTSEEGGSGSTEPTAGSGRSDFRILSDATLDNFYKPGIRLAQVADAVIENSDARPIYDKADAVLLPPKGINAEGNTRKLTYQFDGDGLYLGGVTVTNEDRTAVGQMINAINGTAAHVEFQAQINTVNGSADASFEIKKNLPSGGSITIPWKAFGPMQGPGNVNVTVTNKGSLYTGVVIGANRIPSP